MRYDTNRLFNQQTGIRNGKVNPATRQFAGDPQVISIRIETKQRKPKSVFSPSRTVTASRVTAGLHPDRHDIQFKTDGPRLGSTFHFDRNRKHLATKFDLEFGLAIGDRIESGPITATKSRIGQRERSLFADIARNSVRLNRLHNYQLPITGRGQVDIGRIDIQLHQWRFGNRHCAECPHRGQCERHHENESTTHIIVPVCFDAVRVTCRSW